MMEMSADEDVSWRWRCQLMMEMPADDGDVS